MTLVRIRPRHGMSTLVFPWLLVLGGCVMAPPYVPVVPVPPPTPTPTPFPTPTPVPVPPTDGGTISEWSVLEPLLARAGDAAMTRADFAPLGKPFHRVSILVEPRHVVVGWHVRAREGGAVLNAYAHFDPHEDGTTTAAYHKDSLNVR